MADRITLSPCVWPLYTQTLRFFSNREWEPILYKGTCWWHRPALSSFNKPGGSTEEPMFGWFQGVSTIPPGGMRSDAPALPPKAPPAGVTSCLLSAQLLLTGESLHLSSSSPLHSWLKIHFKNKFIYILITSVITITLPLLRNSSAACRSLSLSEISEKRGLVVCRARSPTGCFSRNKRKPSGHPELCCSPKFSLQVHLILVTRGQDRSDHFRKSTQSSVGCLN